MLEIKNLKLKRDNKEILKGINLKVYSGEIHSILGSNGAGKSTLAYVLMGISDYKPDGGSIIFENQDIAAFSIWQRAKLGITLAWQEPARFEGLTVKDYITVGMKDKNHSLIEEVLHHVLLEPGDYLNRQVDKTLSGGERKRIELASVFAMRPKLAILDEPDSGIDILALDNIVNMIKELKKLGTTVLLITHREEVSEIADRTSLMCSGLIVKEGKPKEVGKYFKEKCIPCPTHVYPSEANNKVRGKIK